MRVCIILLSNISCVTSPPSSLAMVSRSSTCASLPASRARMSWALPPCLGPVITRNL